MLRILLAVAALYVFTGYTKADELKCVPMDKFIADRPPGFEAYSVMTGPEVARAVTFYNSMPGDDLPYVADTIILIKHPSGGVRIVYAASGLACAAFSVPKSHVTEVMTAIMGSPT